MAEIAAPPARVGTSYVEWGAVIAGAVVASAISFVLLTAGSAIGLSLVSPFPSQSYGKLAASLAVFWTVVVPILSFLVGGYIAGRTRSAWSDPAAKDEVEFRDGIHGLLVWSVGIVIGGVLLFLTAASAAQVGTEVAKTALADRATLVAPAVDSLLRYSVAQAEVTPPPAAQTPPQSRLPAGTSAARVTPDTRSEVARILSTAVADGGLKAADRDYLAQVVSARTGLAAPEAGKVVDQAYMEAAAAVDKARRTAVAAALATATALLFALVAAWYAAQRGGRHRDQNIPAKFGWGWRWPPPRRTGDLPPTPNA